jgi:hypothetical protein
MHLLRMQIAPRRFSPERNAIALIPTQEIQNQPFGACSSRALHAPPTGTDLYGQFRALATRLIRFLLRPSGVARYGSQSSIGRTNQGARIVSGVSKRL